MKLTEEELMDLFEKKKEKEDKLSKITESTS